ncbi:hypothetical protein [Paenibacillus harenae]|nr:hypothetical protein [Paenibacillus harenae]
MANVQAPLSPLLAAKQAGVALTLQDLIAAAERSPHEWEDDSDGTKYSS